MSKAHQYGYPYQGYEHTPGSCLELYLQKSVQQLKDMHLQSQTGLEIALKQDYLSWLQNYWMLQPGTFFLRIFL